MTGLINLRFVGKAEAIRSDCEQHRSAFWRESDSSRPAPRPRATSRSARCQCRCGLPLPSA
ncbi:hypothetical protein [Cupriavidus malaysiensis]|uniref:hypothetical protein n=1 Tax=Cupriavidus malaysiensis TaxID=367825 RepID=UPI0012FFB1F4|nr:hypothetical protein [Cupriavidus malaysiensis]